MHTAARNLLALAALVVLPAQVPADPPAFPPILAPAKDGLAIPSPAQLAWADLEVGMFIHMAPQTWQDTESDNLTTKPADINPDKLDTEQWVKVAQSMGARYIVFVAKHEGGFCWWQTKTTEHGVSNSPWRAGKGDVLADLAASCKKHDMKLGVYLSPQDRVHKVGVGGKADDPAKQADYEKLFREQLTEVLSRYGEMMEVWFDGSLVFDVGDILAKHAPNAVVFQGPQATIRWVGNEEGIAPYPGWNAVTYPKAGKKWGDYVGDDGDPRGNRWLPNECDARIRSTWFWKTNNEKTLKSLPKLMEMYEQSVGRGGVLLLNNTPDRSGLIPDADAKRSAELGAEIKRRYGVPAGDVSGKGSEHRVMPSSATSIDRAVLAEEIELGERVRKYVIEGRVDGAWKTLAQGTAIGHKRIERFEAATVTEVRLRITESVGEPRIRTFAVYRAQ